MACWWAAQACRRPASSPSRGSAPPRAAPQRSERGMYALIVVIHIVVSLIIISLVLLQAGKGADIGSAFGGSGSQAVFGSMSTPTVLGKATTAVAVIFMVTSFSLAILAHKRASTIMPATAPAKAPAAAPSSPPAAGPFAPPAAGSPTPAAPTPATK